MPWWFNPIYFESFIALIFGLVIGSFVTALVYRLPRGLPFVMEKNGCAVRSMCPPCGRRLNIKELVPIFSWVLQRGRCACGKNKISLTYPLVEVVCGVYVVLLNLAQPFGHLTWPLYLMAPLILAASFLAIRREAVSPKFALMFWLLPIIAIVNAVMLESFGALHWGGIGLVILAFLSAFYSMRAESIIWVGVSLLLPIFTFL
jgi:leader peptidase (prepilin peptidase) / N-methyltransferase